MATEPVDLLPGYYLEPDTGAWLTLPWPDDLSLLPPSLAPQIFRWVAGAPTRTTPGLEGPRLVHHLHRSQPWEFTLGQMKFLHLWYAVRPDGKWLYRSGVKRGAKGTGKDPMAGALVIIEAKGPVRFDGFDLHGQPVGVCPEMALVQIAANSKDQAGDVLRVSNGMLSYDFKSEVRCDTGLTRTYLDDSTIELLTSSEKSSEGDPADAIMLNEALALDTPIPVPGGWTTMGDLVDGQTILGADGLPTRIVKATAPIESRTCYLVTFQDGDTIVADAGHMWLAKPSGGRLARVMTTREIELADRTVRVPVTEPVKLPEVDLPLDPYALGAWLGDGCRNTVSMSTSKDDMAWWLDEFTRIGVPARHRRTTKSGEEITFAGEHHSWAQRSTGVRSILVGLGIYNEKFVPDAYKRGSVDQRLALLQGLVDTDGHVDKNGRVIFVNTNRGLSESVRELAQSLGHVVQMSTVEDNRSDAYSTIWRVEWQGDADLPSARMPRKRERLRPRSTHSRWLTIKSVERIESVPVRCVAVDNNDHLFLAGRWKATHNTHHMTATNGGQAVAGVARRNVAKSSTGARLLEFTNAHMPGESSVAEDAYEAWQKQVGGLTRRRDILYDSREAAPNLELHVEEDLELGIAQAYGDSFWNDKERIRDEAEDPRVPAADSIRYYFNALPTSETAWVEPRKFDRLHRDLVVADDDPVALFLDCSKSQDATALCACRIGDGHVFTVDMWQRPHGDRGLGWLAPRETVDAVVRATFDRYAVQWFGVDPSPAMDEETEAQYWSDTIDGWHRDFHRRLLLWATPGSETKGSSVLFDMRMSQTGGLARNALFTAAAMQAAADIDQWDPNLAPDGTPPPLTWDGDPRLRLHVHNARRRPNKWGVSLGKRTRDSVDKVDLAVTMVGARMGRRIVLNSGKPLKLRTRKRSKVVVLQ